MIRGTPNPAVTVLMSCYNAERWVTDAIESVLSQTFTDYEFCIIDDGSSDNTLDIVRKYEALDRRIIVLAKSNSGLADSLNIGISQARGDWIARLDADDMCEPDRIESQVVFVRNHPEVVLLGTGCLEIDSYGHVLKTHRYPTGATRLRRHLERRMRFFPHSSALYRTAIVHSLGGYRVNIRRSQDKDLWLRLSEVGRLACLNKPLVRIRKHIDQVSLEESGKTQMIDSHSGTVSYFLRKFGCNDPAVSEDKTVWRQFSDWVETRVEEEKVYERRQIWNDARDAVFSHRSRLIGSLAFLKILLSSPYAGSLIQEKFLGTNLPEQLAREWMDK